MAVYKVIQDIEAEDKLLGPLTLKGFIYAAIAGICAFINWQLLTIHTPLKWLFIFMFLVPMVLFGVLASPLGHEQPTEVWLLSRIRYFLKPRSRTWDQSGLQELVTITAPKKPELHLTKELSPKEVQSRLKTLATTLDTRGWAIKNVDVNLSVPDTETESVTPKSDRLIGNTGMPQQMPVVEVHAADDILDEKNNPTAKKFDTMMKQADAERKRGILAALKGLVSDDEVPARSTPSRHKNSKDLPATKAALAAMKKRQKADEARRKAEHEAALEAELSKARAKFSAEFQAGRKKLDPRHQIAGAAHLKASVPVQPAPTPSSNPVTGAPQAVNMELAQSGNAFSVATISQLANRQGKIQQTGPDEVTISLH